MDRCVVFADKEVLPGNQIRAGEINSLFTVRSNGIRCYDHIDITVLEHSLALF